MKLKYRKAVFVVVYSIKDKTKKEIEYLLLRRKLHWKGWEFPKGKIEQGEKRIQAAKREAKEETRQKILKVKKFNFSGSYKYHKLLPDRPGFVGQTFTLYAGEVKKGRVTLDSKEHNGHKWTDFKTALRMLKWPNQKKSLRIVDSWLMNGKV